MVHVTYEVMGRWYTHAPTLMSHAGAEKVAKRLLSQGYRVKLDGKEVTC